MKKDFCIKLKQLPIIWFNAVAPLSGVWIPWWWWQGWSWSCQWQGRSHCWRTQQLGVIRKIAHISCLKRKEIFSFISCFLIMSTIVLESHVQFQFQWQKEHCYSFFLNINTTYFSTIRHQIYMCSWKKVNKYLQLAALYWCVIKDNLIF